MSIVRALRHLLLGETWVLPLGVLALLLIAAALREIAPDTWHATGGLVLLAGVLAILTTSIAGSGRR